MNPPPRTHTEVLLGLCVGATLIGLHLALHPPLGTSTAGALHGDALHYLSMAAGRPADAPFAWRIGVPWLVSRLPMETELGFTFVTCLGLLVSVLAGWMTGAALGLSRTARLAGLTLASCSLGFAHHLHNPFLTDGAALAVTSLLLWSWVVDVPLCALLLITLGTLARETTFLSGLLWLGDRRWRWALALVATGGVVWACVRMLPGMPTGPAILATVQHVLTTKGPLRIVSDALGAWHGAWVLAIAGALQARGRLRLVATQSMVVLAGSGLALSLVAINTSRMLGFAWPAVSLGLAAFYDSTGRRPRRLLLALLGVSFASLLVWFPNRVTGAALIHPPARVIVTLLGLSCGAAALLAHLGGPADELPVGVTRPRSPSRRPPAAR